MSKFIAEIELWELKNGYTVTVGDAVELSVAGETLYVSYVNESVRGAQKKVSPEAKELNGHSRGRKKQWPAKRIKDLRKRCLDLKAPAHGADDAPLVYHFADKELRPLSYFCEKIAPWRRGEPKKKPDEIANTIGSRLSDLTHHVGLLESDSSSDQMRWRRRSEGR